MSRSLNKVTLIGNLGADPEVRSTTNGSRVATLSVATSRQWKGQDGEKQEKTEWHRVILWNYELQQAGRHRREVLQEGRQGLRRGQHRVSFLAGQGRPDALHHRNPGRRADPAQRSRWPGRGELRPAKAGRRPRGAQGRTSRSTTSPRRSTARTTTCRSEAGRPDIMHDSAPAAPQGRSRRWGTGHKSFFQRFVGVVPGCNPWSRSCFSSWGRRGLRRRSSQFTNISGTEAP